MIPLQYAYMVFALLFSMYWIILFFKRPDLRSAMVIMGILLILAGVTGQYLFWTVDWWDPQTITNTRIGLEDLVHSITIGGIAVSLYPTLFKKHFVRKDKHRHDMEAVVAIVSSLVLWFFLFLVVEIHSFWSTVLVAVSIYCFLIYKRRELFVVSLVSGLILMTAAIPAYMLTCVVSPEFLTFWKFEQLSGVVLFKTPLEDMIFYFTTGASTLPFYLYWKGIELKSL